jgi:hypothetical protein
MVNRSADGIWWVKGSTEGDKKTQINYKRTSEEGFMHP